MKYGDIGQCQQCLQIVVIQSINLFGVTSPKWLCEKCANLDSSQPEQQPEETKFYVDRYSS